MKYNPMTRRMFLQGTGGSLLSIPVLASLLPREAAAQVPAAPPLRFVMVTNDHSPNEGMFFGQLKGRSASLGLQLAPGNALIPTVGYRQLSTISGDISYVLAPFTALKSKISILRSLDVTALEGGPHPISFAGTCAGHGPVSGAYYNNASQPSIDSLLATKIYTEPTPANRRQLVLSPHYNLYFKNGQWLPRTGNTASYRVDPAWSGVNDYERAVRVDAVSDTQLLLQKFVFAQPAQSPAGFDRADMLSRVFGSYRRVSTDPRIGADDRRKLEAYMALISDIQNDVPAAAVCSSPFLEAEAPYIPVSSPTPDDAARLQAITDCRLRNQTRIVTAAMLCDLTRVAAFALNAGSHGYHHASNMQGQTETSNPDAAAFYGTHRRNAEFVANLMRELDKYDTGRGTLLDNSIVYWGQQYGTVYTSGGGHSSNNMPVVLGGGAAGKLKMGCFIDYRVNEGPTAAQYRPEGAPLNNLLVTLANCFGLSSSDYEFKPGEGYGNYAGALGLKLPASSKTIAARRLALPFLYTGPARG